MKKLIIPVFALALAAGAPSIVWAQDDHHDNKSHPHAAAGQGDEAKPVKPMKTETPHANNTGGGNGGMHHVRKSGGNAANDKALEDERERTRALNRGGVKTDTTTMSHDNDHNTGGNDNHGNDNHGNNNNNGNHGKADLSRFHHAVEATHHFRIGAYHAPQNYRYQRWGVGERMPNYYFTRDYWLTDFAIYDLETPPDGYVWVRFGPDALLIDEDTGEVVEVEYGIFI